MSEDEILEQLRVLVRTQLRITTRIDMSSDIKNALQLDSLKLMELVVSIENHFRVCLDDELTTVGDVVRSIARSAP